MKGLRVGKVPPYPQGPSSQEFKIHLEDDDTVSELDFADVPDNSPLHDDLPLQGNLSPVHSATQSHLVDDLGSGHDDAVLVTSAHSKSPLALREGQAQAVGAHLNKVQPPEDHNNSSGAIPPHGEGQTRYPITAQVSDVHKTTIHDLTWLITSSYTRARSSCPSITTLCLNAAETAAPCELLS